MRPNPTNFVGLGMCGQTTLLQRNFNIIPPTALPLKKCGLTARSISHKVCGIWTHLYILTRLFEILIKTDLSEFLEFLVGYIQFIVVLELFCEIS